MTPFEMLKEVERSKTAAMAQRVDALLASLQEFAAGHCPAGSSYGGQFTGPGNKDCGGAPTGGAGGDRIQGPSRDNPNAPSGGGGRAPKAAKAKANAAAYAKHLANPTGVKNPYGPDNPYSAKQPYGPDYNKKGKPFPGSKEWNNAHGITQEQFDRRYVPVPARRKGDDGKYSATSKAIEDSYGKNAPSAPRSAADIKRHVDFMNGVVAKTTEKMDEFDTPSNMPVARAMKRHAVDKEAERIFGPPLPEIRPNEKVIVAVGVQRRNDAKRARAQAQKDLKTEAEVKTAIAQQHKDNVARAKAAYNAREERLHIADERQTDAENRIKQYQDPKHQARELKAKETAAKTAGTRYDAALKAWQKVADDPNVEQASRARNPVAERQRTALKNLKIARANKDRADKALLHEQSNEPDARINRAKKDINDAKNLRRKAQADVAQAVAMSSSSAALAVQAGVLDPKAAKGLIKKYDPDKKEYVDVDPSTIKVEPRKAVAEFRKRAQDQLDKADSKEDSLLTQYAFPQTGKTGVSKDVNFAARVDVAPGQNRENLVNGVTDKNGVNHKGRVYIAVEGVIKADAVENHIRKQGSDESVANVPSVTLWRTREMGYLAEKHMQGREAVIINDADEAAGTKIAVRDEGRLLKAHLLNHGVGSVKIVAPPLTAGGKNTEFDLPSGAKEGDKGVDDYLHQDAKGVSSKKHGGHTLANLVGVQREPRTFSALALNVDKAKREAYDQAIADGHSTDRADRIARDAAAAVLRDHSLGRAVYPKGHPQAGKPILDTRTVDSTMQALRTISMLGNKVGTGDNETRSARVSLRSISQTMKPDTRNAEEPYAVRGGNPSTAKRAIERLEALGIIKREPLFVTRRLKGAPIEAGQVLKLHPDMAANNYKRFNELIKARIIPHPDADHLARLVKEGRIADPGPNFNPLDTLKRIRTVDKGYKSEFDPTAGTVKKSLRPFSTVDDDDSSSFRFENDSEIISIVKHSTTGATTNRHGNYFADDPVSDKPTKLGNGARRIATEEGLAYYRKLYGVTLQIGDPIPVGAPPKFAALHWIAALQLMEEL